MNLSASPTALHRRPTRRLCGRVAALAAALLLVTSCSGGSTSTAATPSTEPGTTTTDRSPAPTSSGPTTIEQALAPAPSPGCRTATSIPVGSSEIDVTSGGLDRVSDVYMPSTAESDGPAPLIVDFHAFGARALEQSFSGLTRPGQDGSVPADDARTIVLTPLGIAAGTTPAWNTTDYPQWADDDRFVVDLLDQVENQVCVDTRRIYLTGFAIGAQMAAVVACRHSERITAFAAVAGLFDPEGCSPSRPVPVLAFHGKADPMIPYGGGIGPNVPLLGLDAATTAGEAAMTARLAPIPEVARRWADRNGCEAEPEGSEPGPDVILSVWPGCVAPVELYTFATGGHAWPRSPGTRPLASILGPTPDSIDATAVMLDFFHDLRLPRS